LPSPGRAKEEIEEVEKEEKTRHQVCGKKGGLYRSRMLLRGVST